MPQPINIADCQSPLVQILRMRITDKAIQRQLSIIQNLDDFRFLYDLSQYPGVLPNLRAELVPSHGASCRLGKYSICLYYLPLCVYFNEQLSDYWTEFKSPDQIGVRCNFWWRWIRILIRSIRGSTKYNQVMRTQYEGLTPIWRVIPYEDALSLFTAKREKKNTHYTISLLCPRAGRQIDPGWCESYVFS